MIVLLLLVVEPHLQAVLMEGVSAYALLHHAHAVGVVARDTVKTELGQQCFTNRTLVLSTIACPAPDYVPLH